MKITAYFDGACEPINPGGYASYGAVVFIDGKRVWEKAKLFKPKPGRRHETSNNVAEYSGFKAILDYLVSLRTAFDADITIYGDSALVIYQNSIDPRYNKKWQVRGGFYVPICKKAQKILPKFTNLTLKWIPREENSIADELSKRGLIEAGVEFRIQPNI